MSRLTLLARHPRRTLATLGTVLAAVGVTYASGADFTAQSANPANTFSTGTLTMSNSKDNAAVLTASGLRPGAAATEGTVDIANTGSLSGAFTLKRETPVDSDTTNPLSGKLNAVIDDCGVFTGSTAPTCGDGDDVTKYTGTIAGARHPVEPRHVQRERQAPLPLPRLARPERGQQLPGRHLHGRVHLERGVVRATEGV